MSDNANDPVDPQRADNSAPTGEPVHEAESPAPSEVPEWQAPAQSAEPTVVFNQPEQPGQPQQPAQPQQATPPQAPDYSQPRPQPRWGEYAPQQGQHPTQPYPQGQPQYGQQNPGQYGQPPYTQQYPGQYGSYGQQPPQHTQPTQPVGGQHPYYSQFSGQPPKDPKGDKPKGERSLSSRSIGLIAAGLVVGALIGGGVGGGIAASTVHGGGTPVNISSGSGAGNITVNDPKNASQVTAVAAKASNSVVTINVTGSQESGTGSGVILTSDGYILTNTHVVTLDGDTSSVTIQVQTNDGKLYTAKVIGTDPTDDLAVIKLNNASGLTPISWGSSSKLNVGDQVIAIGAPLGLQGTVTDGIVSALNRSVSLQSSAVPQGGSGSDGGNQNPFGSGNPFDPGQQSSDSNTISVPAIQTDAAINPGNSGGALLNDTGQLVGINVAIASTGSSSDGSSQSGNIGVGFAIPADVAHRIADELKAQGKATHGLLGATVSNAAAQSNATTVGGRIQSVTSGGAAAKAGLKAGDVVTNVNGVPITSADDLTAQIRAQAAGAKVTIIYVRDGKTYQTTATLGTYNAPQ